MKKNKLLLILLILVSGALGLYLYVYKNHRDIASEKESFAITTDALYEDFETNEIQSNQKYLDKTIAVSGKVSSVDLSANLIVLDGKLTAVFKAPLPTKIDSSATIKIKGRFLGYDDLLEELKMDQCDLLLE